MPITINGSGTLTGISAGGLPDDSIIAADIAAGAVTAAKVADANITAAKLSGAQSGSAPIYGARAWVNFDGTGVVAIRASGNVSSITDNGVGDYTVNFTTAMPDANYSFGAICSSTVGASGWVARIANTAHVTTGSLRIQVVDPTVAVSDALIVGLIIIR